jgi:hypothetical protein
MIGIRKRRELGLTVKNIREVTKRLKDSGELDGLDNAAIAAAVLDEIVQANPQLAQDPGVDWDSILAFIERLLPLILKLIDLFS